MDSNNKINAKKFFDKRVSSYNRVSKWANNEELNLASDEFLNNLRGEIALDLGAGTGILISRVKNFQMRVALDISQEMLSAIEDSTIVKVVGDIHNLMFPDQYADLIICRQVLHYCDLKKAFQNIKRVLKINGFLHIVQVVDFKNVPEHWDQEWASFRNVKNRRHLRTSELVKFFQTFLFKSVKAKNIILREQYSWDEFYAKHNIENQRKEEVREFFSRTPNYIAKEIDLSVDTSGISYNRNFGLWLLKSV